MAAAQVAKKLKDQRQKRTLEQIFHKVDPAYRSRLADVLQYGMLHSCLSDVLEHRMLHSLLADVLQYGMLHSWLADVMQ